MTMAYNDRKIVLNVILAFNCSFMAALKDKQKCVRKNNVHYVTEHTIVYSQRDFGCFTNGTQQTVVTIIASTTKENSR